MSETTTLPMMDSALSAAVLEFLSSKNSPQPVSAMVSKLRSRLGLPKKATNKDAEPVLQERLDKMVQAGQLFRLQPTRKNSKPEFFSESAESLARSALRQIIPTDGPISAADIKKARELKAAKKFLSAAQLDRILADLAKSGDVYEWPKLGKKITKVRYSHKPADAREYLDPALGKLRKELQSLADKLQLAGITQESLERACAEALGASRPTPGNAAPAQEVEDLGALLLEIMEAVEPAARNGAAVPIPALRRAMEFQNLDKRAFDTEALRLAEREIVDLHRHDYPAGLSQAERDDLISDGRGGFYIVIARRT